MSEPTKTCPDCGGLPGINPKNRCPVCQVKNTMTTPEQDELMKEIEIAWLWLTHGQHERSLERSTEETRRLIEAYANKRCEEMLEKARNEERSLAMQYLHDTNRAGDYKKRLTLKGEK